MSNAVSSDLGRCLEPERPRPKSGLKSKRGKWEAVVVVEPAAAISIGSSRSILLPTPRPNKITIVQARILGAFEWVSGNNFWAFGNGNG